VRSDADKLGEEFIRAYKARRQASRESQLVVQLLRVFELPNLRRRLERLHQEATGERGHLSLRSWLDCYPDFPVQMEFRYAAKLGKQLLGTCWGPPAKAPWRRWVRHLAELHNRMHTAVVFGPITGVPGRYLVCHTAVWQRAEDAPAERTSAVLTTYDAEGPLQVQDYRSFLGFVAGFWQPGD